jgi:hypothetical protein
MAHAKLLSDRTAISNPATIFCSPGPAIKTNQRRAKPLAVPNATGKIFLQRSDRQLTLKT